MKSEIDDMINSTTSPAQPACVSLTQLRVGDQARFHSADLQCDDCDMLNAMGMTHRCPMRVCKAGNPWIVQVRSTRIGLSKLLAKHIQVVPIAGSHD